MRTGFVRGQAELSLKDVAFKEIYNPGKFGEDVVGDFLVPALRQAKSYQRVAGYFSSSVLAVAAQGIAGLVENGGIYQLVTSHHLTKLDKKDLSRANEETLLEDSMIATFLQSWRDLEDLGSALKLRHSEAMLWLLKEGRLELKIVVPFRNDQVVTDGSLLDLFHPKFGLINDFDGDSVAFGGSANESMNAWQRNLENIMVYESWKPGKGGYIEGLRGSFYDYWTGENNPGWKTIGLPEAVKSRLLNDLAPDEFPELPVSFSRPSPHSDLVSSEETTSRSDSLWPYQRARVSEWLEKDRKGLLEMATGTGKTKTATECIRICAEDGKLLTVVAVPYRHIGDQWISELQGLNPIAVDGTSNWRSTLRRLVAKGKLDQLGSTVLVGVKDTLASSDCQELIAELANQYENFLLVADEVHWFGARTYQAVLSDRANFRLGLSATPKRYFDDEGTDFILGYFENRLQEFDLAKALSTYKPGTTDTILCPYEYHPVVVELEDDEQEQLAAFNRKIAVLLGQEDGPDMAQKLLDTRIARARITKKARQKLPAFDSLLSTLEKPLSQCIVYCEDTAQLDAAAEILNRHQIYFNKITGVEGTSPSPKWGGVSQRSHYLSSFARGELGVLLAMDCLDEGVDIPTAEIGILLASSGNTKEFIQRRGRLMRHSEGKQFARIYDFVVKDQGDTVDSEVEILLANEIRRIDEFAGDALNRDEILAQFSQERVI